MVVLVFSFLPLADKIPEEECIFQQGNDAVHFSTLTKLVLEANDTEVLDLLTEPPGLNIGEILWDFLTRRLYA